MTSLCSVIGNSRSLLGVWEFALALGHRRVGNWEFERSLAHARIWEFALALAHTQVIWEFGRWLAPTQVLENKKKIARKIFQVFCPWVTRGAISI